MKSVAVVFALVASSLALTSAASACAMRRRIPDMLKPAKLLIADGDRAMKRGQHQKAAGIFEDVMKQPSARRALRADAAYKAGLAHQRLGNLDRATDRFRRAVGLDKKHSGAQLALGRALAGDDEAGAVVALGVALKLGKLSQRDRADAEALIAGSLARLGRVVPAGRHLETARRLKASKALLDEAQAALDAASGARPTTLAAVI